MFATIIIILPSSFTGGEVHVSHATSSRVYDLAPSSAFTTSVLTWYTDVMHEVKPIASGYRLALSYNLIHTSQGIPRPMLPNMHAAVTFLRSVLRRWTQGGYKCTQNAPHLVAYLLAHQYSEVNLKAGALKGQDEHMISHLRGPAEEFSIMVCLANLSYHVYGYADDYGGRGKRYGQTPSMLEELDRSMKINNVVDLNGNEMLAGKDMGIYQKSLIPEDAFEDLDPDTKGYTGYSGNVRQAVSDVYHGSRGFIRWRLL
jgi:hypothetical protein